MRSLSRALAGTRRHGLAMTCAAALVLAAAACSGDAPATAPIDPDAAELAERTDRLADSIGTASDPFFVVDLRQLSSLLRTAGRVSTVDIDVDGTPTSFHAIAIQWTQPGDAPTFGAMMPTHGVRVLAWSGDAPRQLISLLAYATGDFPIAHPASMQLRASATLSWQDRGGPIAYGVSGSERMTLASTGGACAANSTRMDVGMLCRRATFDVGFGAALAGSPLSSDGPYGPSTLKMRAQRVAGVVLAPR